MQKRNVLDSPRLLELKKKRHKAFFSKILILFLGLLVLLFGSAYISRLDNLNIKEIQISGNKVIETATLQASAQELIAGKYLWLFPKTNILFYPQETIAQELQNKFKRIKDIDLSIKDNKILLISITERLPKFTWCGVIPNLDNHDDSKCYFMDDSGDIFDVAPYFSEGVYFKFYGDENINQENPVGYFFLKDRFTDIVEFKNQIESMNLSPVSFWIDSKGNARFYLSSKSTPGPEIIFKIESDYQNLAENLDAAIDTEPLKSKLKNKFSSLEYIDLRYGNKVYDKFK